MAAPTFRSANGGSAAGNAGTAVIPSPAGLVSGDLLLVNIAYSLTNFVTPAVTPPAGWTILAQAVSVTNVALIIYQKLASAPADTVNLGTWSWANGDSRSRCLFGSAAWSNVNQNTPINGVVSGNVGGSDVSAAGASAPAWPSLTTTMGGCVLVTFGAALRSVDATIPTWTPPPGQTERREAGSVSTWARSTVVNDEFLPGAPLTTGTRTGALSVPANVWLVVDVAIAPAVVAVTATDPVGLLDPRALAATRTLSDAEGLADSRSRLAAASRLRLDVVGSLDSATGTSGIVRALVDLVGTVDSTASNDGRPSTDPLPIADDATAGFGLSQLVHHQLTGT